MHFSLSQIIAINVPLIIALIVVLFWYKRDSQTQFFQNKENLPTLISVFFWAAFGGLMLKLCIDMIYHFDHQSVILSSIWFYLFSIFIEEIIKGGSLIIGLEIAEKRFNEVSDGIIYGSMAALGFLFFENIFYLLNTTSTSEFLRILTLRYFSTFGIHLLTTSVFGLTYAKGYLGYKKRLKTYQAKYKIKDKDLKIPQPYDFFYHLKSILTIGNFFLNLIKLVTCYDLFKRIFLILSKKEMFLLEKDRFPLFPSVFIVEGFLLGFYLHLTCNSLLQNQLFGWILLTIMPFFSFMVYLGFIRLDRQ